MYKIFIPWYAVFNAQFTFLTKTKLFRKILTKTKKYSEIFHQNGKIGIRDIWQLNICTVEIWIPDTFMICFWMVKLRWQNLEFFPNFGLRHLYQTLTWHFYHSKTGLVRYSDSDCIGHWFQLGNKENYICCFSTFYSHFLFFDITH